MTRISLTLIQTFYQLARLGSFTAAARELGVTYQAVANQVRRLEALMGERLVISEQGARKVELTPRGLALYQLIRPELDIMLSRLNLLMERGRPMLRIGMPQAVFVYLFTPVMERFRALHPGVEVVVYERDTALADLVGEGRLDLFLAERHFGDPMVIQHLIGRYPLSLAYPEAWGPPPAPGAVRVWARGRPFVSHEPGQTLRDMATDFLGGAEPVLSTSSSVSVKRCVEEGLGFAILPAWCLQPGDRGIAALPLPDLPGVRLHFGMARFLRDMPAAADLRDLCRAHLLPPA